jgi:hypothetical protein
VRHCFQVIDGYGQRFNRMKKAEGKHVAEHHIIEVDPVDPC